MGVYLTVVIPSWDSERALNAIMEMLRRQVTQVRYVVVGCAEPQHEDGLTYDPVVYWIDSEYPLSPVEAMALGAQHPVAVEAQVLAFLHDDASVLGLGWDKSILNHFAARPQCGLIGFGGGLGFATDDIYKSPYDYRQLARIDFVSNMQEAEQHGRRMTSACQVAALDGFSMIVTREMYERMGGWGQCATDGIFFHMDDAWISCKAAELGYETWMLPVECHHAGGQTSVGMQERYAKVVERLGFSSPQDLYDKAHATTYKRFQRVLPIRVPHNHRLTGKDGAQ